MKRKNLRLGLTSLMVVLLVGVMAASSAFTSFYKTRVNVAGPTNSAIQQTAVTPSGNLKDYLDPNNLVETNNVPKSDDTVELIIRMDDNSLFDIYEANPGSYESFADYRLSTQGRNAAENLTNKQNALFNKIARSVDATLEYNYVNAINAFAIKVKYGDRALIDKIGKEAKIQGTELSHSYAAPDTTVVTNQVSALATGIFDSSKSIADGYGGQGIVVAVLDTGIDWEHIAFDPTDPRFTENNTNLKFTEDYIKSKLTSLSAYKMQDYTEYNKEHPNDQRTEEDYDKSAPYLTAADVYKNAKIPFAYDYADKDPEVSSHYNNLHGTHVAGIIAGHSDDPRTYHNPEGNKDEIYLREVKKDANGKETVKYYQRKESYQGTTKTWTREYNDKVTDANTQPIYDDYDDEVTGILGVAPKAQLAVFKVFPDFDAASSGTHLLAALEDCMTLDVDVINMSLGSDCGFQEDSGSFNSVYDVYEKLNHSGISLAVAASNSYSSGFSSYYGLNLTSNPDSATVGTPGTYDAAMSVASVSGVPSKYLLATNGQDEDAAGYREFGTAYYTDAAHLNGDTYDFLEDIYNKVNNDPVYSQQYKQADGTLRIPYVTIPGTGAPANYAGKDLEGKIALVSRGSTTFEEKIQAAQAARALACIVYNNASGVIRMNIGDNITIPACSINMDEAAKIKYKDTEFGSAYFVIDPHAEAGPFMSEFSSWGPLPNLLLKPDITAHGGEIYSAVPGGVTAYERMSGTSMACPNMAGVFALLRQYMQTKDTNGKFTVAEKFGVTNEKGEIDKLLMEHRIDQILMSTATITMNEDGNPYSPRKQGAGIADLERSRAAEQYLITKDSEGEEMSRTKIELLDDPAKKGQYDMTFYARNVSDAAVEYDISSYVFTEGISSNDKTVTEKAHMLAPSNIAVKVDGNAVTDGKVKVPAKDTTKGYSEVKVEYSITLSQSDRDWLNRFSNGMYVEGYICLTDVTSGKDEAKRLNLNVPFLGFYGDWSQAPIFDYDIYQVNADEHDDNINEEDKRYANNRPLQIIGKVMENGSDYAMGLGSFAFVVPDELKDMNLIPDAREDFCALSYNNESCICNLYGVCGYLRPAKKVFYTITDATTGDIIIDDVYMCARKASAAGSVGGAWIDLDLDEITSANGKQPLNNGKYNVAIYPVLDWCSETYPSNTFNTRQDVIDYFEDYNRNHPENPRQYTWSSNFWIDTDAPFLSNTELRIEKDKKGNASYYLDMYVTDNHYACALGFNYWDKDQKKFRTPYETNGLYPINSARNSTTRVTYELTGIWDQVEDGLKYLSENKNNPQVIEDNPELGTNLTQVHVMIYDYAFNRSYYNIDLTTLLKGYNDLAFGDITNTREYTNSNGETIEVMTSVKDTIEPLSDGTYKMRSDLTMVPGQKLPLVKAVIPNPIDAETGYLKFSFDGDVNSDTYPIEYSELTKEIYAARPGTAVITVETDKYNGTSAPSATLTITVLTEQEISDYRINTNSIVAPQNLTGLIFNDYDYSRYFNAGESYVLEAKPDPWYYDIDKTQYFVKWTSSDENLATVKVDENDSFKATVTAASSTTDENDKFVMNREGGVDIKATLYKFKDGEAGPNDVIDDVTKKPGQTIGLSDSGIYRAVVRPEFVVEGGTLTEYHGSSKKVVIPAKDLDIKVIGSMLFLDNEDIEEIVFGEGITTIAQAACANMKNLRKITLPSTLYNIGENAFSAYYSFEYDAPETKFTEIDSTACTVRPLEISPRAFSHQRYIGVNWDESHINGVGEKYEKNVVLLTKEQNKFDTRMIRSVGEYGFYGLAYLSNIDLSGLRGAETASFYLLGNAISQHCAKENGKAQHANVTFGESTFFGEAAFGQHGIGSATLKMRRISQQGLFGVIEFADNEEDEDKPLLLGELEEITFTADGLIIEDGAFLYSSVKKITFEGWVDTIGEAAFAYAKNLESVTFCDKAEKSKNRELPKDTPVCRMIGAQAFMETGLTKVDLPDGLQVLGQAAFYNCTKLKEVNISKNCRLLDAYKSDSLSGSSGAPFYGCSSLSKFTVAEGNPQLEAGNGTDDSNKSILYSKTNGSDDKKMIVCVPISVEVKEEMLSDVKAIATYAFAGNKATKNLNLSSIESIGEGAFYRCEGLESITLPSTLTAIPSGCFIGCTKLKSIEMTNCTNLKEIGESAFAESGIESVTFSSATNKIGSGAFMDCTKLTTVNMPTAVTEVPEACFYGCTSLSTVIFNNVSNIGRQAFTLSGIVEINDNAGRIKTVGYAAFAACSSLKTVTLSGVETIDDAAFVANISDAGEVNTSLESVKILNVKSIGTEAFAFQEKIPSIDIDVCETINESAFLGCTGLVGVYASRVKFIGEQAFYGCENLSYFVANDMMEQGVAALPATLEFVDSSAFTSTGFGYFYVEGQELGIEGYPYFSEDGVLYRYVPNGVELVTFPTLKYDPIVYTIREDTVRIDKYAFAGIENVIQVDIPDSCVSIGDSAFLYSSVKVYNFLGYNAPELDAWYSSYDSEYQDGTRNVFFWQVYRNFLYPFNYTYGSSAPYKYNNVRPYQDDELELYMHFTDSYGNPTTRLQNTSYTGGGFSDADYFFNMVILYASNATGFDSFVWDNYFDSKVLKPELIEQLTLAVIDLIKALPPVDELTINDKAAVELARARFEALTHAQRAFIEDAGLEEVLVNCEKRIALLATDQPTSNDAIEAVVDLINAIPSAEYVTEDDRAAVEAARAAYDALSQADKDAFNADHADLVAKLEACEAKLNEKSGCGGCNSCNSCGTVTFGGGNGGGGIGLMAGIVTMALVCVAVVLFRKRKADKQ